MCITGNGILAGQNARSARRSMTIESLPPENSRTGRSNSRRDLAHDVDGLGFERVELGQRIVVTHWGHRVVSEVLTGQ